MNTNLHWFAPRPWPIATAETDVRAGGTSLVVMRSPDGHEFPNTGVYREVVVMQYTARARHWTVADREAHEKMGFHEGWGQCADQLEELVATL